MAAMGDLQEVMQFDPDDGIADLDAASRPAQGRGRGAGLQVRPPRRPQRAPGGDLRQAPASDRAAAAVADRRDGDRGECRARRRAGSAAAGRRPGPAPPHHCRPSRRISRMMGVEPAGQRAERRHDELGWRSDEAAARNVAAFQVEPELGMKVAGNFRARLAAHRFVAKDDAAGHDLFLDPSAAMVGEAGIVVADDPHPVETLRSGRSAARGRWPAGGRSRSGRGSCRRGNRGARAPVALDVGGKRAQRRVRIIGRQELPEPREPARFFKVQVGDQQRLPAAPVERAGSGREECFACERKGNHAAGCEDAGSEAWLDALAARNDERYDYS